MNNQKPYITRYRQHNGQKKRGKRQRMIHKTLHRKLQIEQHEPTKKNGDTFRYSGRVSSGIRCVTAVTKPVISYD